MVRLAIIGGPRVGKSVLARELAKRHGIAAMHTDDVMHLGWSPASEAASHWFSSTGSLIVEGVAAVRALRKWLEANREGKPCLEVLVLTKAFEQTTAKQDAMCKGIHTVLDEIRPELERRGVVITYGRDPRVSS